MLNLLANALKFSRPGIPARIRITSKISTGLDFQKQTIDLQEGSLLPGRNYCCISFADNGIGFEPQFLDKIFEVFQQLNSKEEYEGTGIGLAIVKKIVENHKGLITATGELNNGATFHIYIPVKDDVHL
ncbi:MAG: ATP-binding protein [Bacteroidota bacterium]|nr:ATP-binding protein [Bacteroidota bacterium]